MEPHTHTHTHTHTNPDSQSHLEKEQNIMLPDFKLYYKTIVIKIVWNCHKNRPTDQLNTTERQEINLCVYG